ncbi:MAG: serine/threonine protein kinase [Bryobacterales bacterium]|nr:serine/threonine protein kinase [Bryobacterales bacterium]
MTAGPDQSRLRFLFEQLLDSGSEAAQDAALQSLAGTADAQFIPELRRLFQADRQLALPLPQPYPAPEPLPAFGPFQATKILGRGGMGTVYLATRDDGQFQQTVAVKAALTPILDLTGKTQFLRERQILAGLRHPGIASLVDGGVTPDGTPFLAMEFIDGLHLDAYCNQHRLSIRHRLLLFREVCDAVAFAHRNLIVHRDLKPSNILVTADGRPKLLDFGAARMISDDLTLGPSMITPRYASPEQLRREPITTASDVYSLGIVLAELVSGRWPFGDPASSLQSLRRAVEPVDPAPLDKDPSAEHAGRCDTPLARFRLELAGDLSAIVTRALDPQPTRRYRSIDAFNEDLRRYLAGEPVLARPQTRSYRLAKFLSRNRREAVAVSVGLSLLLAIAFLGVDQYRRRLLRSTQLRDLNRVLLGEVYQEVGQLPGSAKARALVATHTQHALDALLAENPADASVRESLATAYIRLAEVQGEPFSLSLGDTAGALESYRNAEKISSSHPALLVRARIGIAGLLIRAGEYIQAASLIRQTLPLAESLWRQHPHGAVVSGQPVAILYFRLHKVLGHALLREADRHYDARRMMDALKQNELAVSVADEIQKADPALNDLAGKQSQYVGFAHEILARRSGDYSRFQLSVRAHLRAAEGVARDFAKSGSGQDRRDLADAFSFLGAARILALDDAGATRDLATAAAHFNALASADLNARELDLDLALAHFFWGEAEIGLGRLDSAARHLRKAESLARLPANPTDIDREKVELFVRVHQQWARLHRVRRNYAAALQSLTVAEQVGRVWKKLPVWEMERMSRKRHVLQAEQNGRRADAVPHDWLH